MADVMGAGDEHRVRRAVMFPVTSTRDGFEHLVAEEAMTPANGGRYVAMCGCAIQTAALACPPGPRCPACTAVRNAVPVGRQRHRRTDQRGAWARLTALLRHPRPARSAPPQFPDVTLPLSSVVASKATRLDDEAR